MNWLSSLLSKKEKLVVGLSSGTSMDGIDAVLVAISGSGADTEVRIEDFICRDYSPTAKGILFAPHALEAADVSDLNFQLGSEFAEAVVEILRRNGLETTDVDLVGSHGQTIFHNPPSLNFDIPSTLQVGEPDVICEETGITTVADFRTRDLAAGGEGAPLVPYADFILFSGTRKNIIAQNIGGISNCALVTGKFEELIAFDTGPGNSLVDSVVRIDSDDEMFYDKDGSMASEGSVDEGLLRELMRDFYLRRKPPKSTGTERFGMEMADQYFLLVENGELAVEDLLRTLVEFTARSIADAYERFIYPSADVDEVVLSGGGARNPLLVSRLADSLGEVPLVFSDDYGIPVDAKEAVAFAILANEAVCANRGNVPAATGARGPTILGKISIGKNHA